jgi:NADH dehydrogenase [ubiquinone] 1 alpha subcomplex assembly factor 2
MRRIVKQHGRVYASDVQVSPQWHQWLRHVREHPPSQAEQAADVVRLRELKARAALADEAWAMKGRIADTGNASRSAEMTGKQRGAAAGVGEATRGPAFDVGGKTIPAEGREKEGRGARRSGNEAERDADDTAAPAPTTAGKQEKDDPWKQSRRNPGEEWQPQSWAGGPAPAREKHR